MASFWNVNRTSVSVRLNPNEASYYCYKHPQLQHANLESSVNYFLFRVEDSFDFKKTKSVYIYFFF